MSEYVIAEKKDLTAIANAIRAKTGRADGMALVEMAANINDVETVGSGGFSVKLSTVEATCDIPSQEIYFGEIITGDE